MAILEFDNPDDLVEFLNDVARDLHDLNQYADSPLLDSRFAEFVSKVEEISQ